VKISFCIPTYNHGKFLGATLESILAQAPPEFEILIVDGASTDETPQVVARYQQRTKSIHYRRLSANRGVDPDLAETVAMASGEYCWMISSDDVIPAGSVARVLDALRTRSALYLGGRIDCTEGLVPLGNVPLFAPSPRRKWDFQHEDQLLDYLNRAVGLICLFSYMSILIIRRDVWNRAPDAAVHYGSCYAHAFRLWTALAGGEVVEALDIPVALCRLDTDNFASRGVYRRFLLDFDGYLEIANTVWGARSAVRSAFVRVIAREHGKYALAKFYHSCRDAAQRQTALSRLKALGVTAAQIRVIVAIASIGPLLPYAAVARRKLRRLWRSLQYRRQAASSG
jgi:O-antigen biosynthesis alpha-1,3-abequosyltransferase